MNLDQFRRFMVRFAEGDAACQKEMANLVAYPVGHIGFTNIVKLLRCTAHFFS